jgi:hypothetical protein
VAQYLSLSPRTSNTILRKALRDIHLRMIPQKTIAIIYNYQIHSLLPAYPFNEDLRGVAMVVAGIALKNTSLKPYHGAYIGCSLNNAAG